MRPEPVLRVEQLNVALRTRSGVVVNVLDGVDLELMRGETLGVVGESGSGKTMTALAIMRLLPEAAHIAGGHIWFDHEDLTVRSEADMAAVRGRGIAMIPQDPMTSLNPVFTIGNQLLESVGLAQRRGGQSARARAEELLTQVKIADPRQRLRNYPHQMSGGMRQRVVGALALAGMPQIIIADEPTTSLDATVQLQYLELLKQIQSETGVAILFITHDFGIVAQMCDRVAVMYAGKVVESATVSDLFSNPQHPYSQALIHALPVLGEEPELLPTIKGQPPVLDQLPVGCSFSPRCPHAFERCAVDPPAFAITPNHTARCWLRETEA